LARSPDRELNPDDADPAAKPYHHGHLKAALIAGAAELLAERGVQDFSVAELSRRIGVTAAAPYRHFANRDELLVAVAVRAVSAFGDALSKRAARQEPPEQRLAAIASAWVRFAAEQPALYAIVFGAGLDQKKRHPELKRAYKHLDAMLDAPTRELFSDDPAAADRLADAIEAIAHGYAMRLAAEPAPPPARAVNKAARDAARAARAIIEARAVLAGSE
jgi:AcrR family transcriptional regulator